MTTVHVDGRTASLIERTFAILESKSEGLGSLRKTRKVPVWLPDGEEVKSLAQAAVMMGVTPETAAHYCMEQKNVTDELKAEAKKIIVDAARARAK